MTMTDPYDVTELTALANSLFPDLTDGISYSPSGEVPDTFDWEHPFAYGSTAEAAKSYSPAVQSKTEAAEADRRIDVPTSLQGSAVEAIKEEG